MTPAEAGQLGAGPLLVGYPLLIVAAGTLFPRAAGHLHDGRLRRFVRRAGGHRPRTDHPNRNTTLIYAAALGVIGFMVGYQAYRIRLLTRYFEKEEKGKDEG